MKPPANESPAPVGSFTSSIGNAGSAERMTADAERAFAKENGCAVFAVLDDQSLRPHGQHFVGGARQVGFAGEHLGFRVIDQQHVDQFQRFGEFVRARL